MVQGCKAVSAQTGVQLFISTTAITLTANNSAITEHTRAQLSEPTLLY